MMTRIIIVYRIVMVHGGGDAVMDECDVCGGDGIAEGTCDCNSTQPLQFYNCDGSCSTIGEEAIDGICDGQLSIDNIITPKNYRIASIYPNPFNPITHINYELPEYTNVHIVIFDLTGKKVQSLISELQAPGYHSVKWNAENYASGIYFIKMVSGGYVNTQKLMLIK